MAASRYRRLWRPDPITEAELDLIEAHFADFLDEVFGPRL